jgi:hypothetical protein
MSDLRKRDREGRPESADAGDEPEPTRDAVLLLIAIIHPISSF